LTLVEEIDKGFFMEIDAFLKIHRYNPSISIDTRTIAEGDIFFALKGENFDGNKFVQKALDNGAAFVVCEDAAWKGNEKIIVVENSLDFLQRASRAYRDTFEFPIIAITGSNGKTTTKELCLKVLQSTFKVAATKGNYNNHIGVPLTILSAPVDLDYLIVEMGANHVGEIDALCRIADPDIGIITNIGKAHLEGFGGIQGVIKGKTELYRYLNNKKGTIIYNSQDKVLVENLAKDACSVPYLDATIIKTSPSIELIIEGHVIKSCLMGLYNVENIRCACSLGNFLEIDFDHIQSSISSYIPSNNRSELTTFRGATVFLDAYNANPTSMEASILSFNKSFAEDKIVILGDMLELGEYATQEHIKICELLDKNDFDEVILIGDVFSQVGKEYFQCFRTVKEAKPLFDQMDLQDKAVLLKGSRGLKLEELLKNDH
jgi:UDP-N-acetylmuramoyl-tripeptide--D-alanyl-D-alanine ligase